MPFTRMPVVTLLLALLLVARPSLGQDPPADPPIDTEPHPVETLEIHISAAEFAFTPNQIEVPVGTPVRLVFSNNGSITHSLAIAELTLQTATIRPGDSEALEFTAEHPGTLHIACRVAGHSSVGMTGEIVVTE